MRFLDPARLQRPRVGVIAIAVAMAALVLGHSIWLTALLDPALSAGTPGRLLLVNALPLLLLTLSILALGGRIGLAVCLASGLWVLLFAVSARKMEHLGVPLQAQDLLVAASGGFSPGLLYRYADFTWHQVTWILLLPVTIALCLRFEPRQLSLPSAAGLALLVVASAITMQRPESVLGRYVQADWIPIKAWHPIDNAQRNGLMATINKQLTTSWQQVPQPSPGFQIDPAPDRSPLPRVLPDIIVVMSESFFRPDSLKGVNQCFGTPNYCALRDRAVWGDLVVPTYGGATVRTEFEFLTSLSLANFPNHRYPYISLVRSPTPSLAWDLKALGYRNLAIHPHIRTFWNRQTVYPLLGFDELRGLESFRNAEKSGFYISDAALTRSIREELATSSEQPRFVFAISMENHGPWGKRPNVDAQRVAGIAIPPGLSGEQQRQWQEYIYHLANADRELAALVDLVDARDRPTVLLFFGDHLPSLKKVFADLPPRDAANHSAIPTPYVLVSNQPMQSRRVDSFAYRLGPLTLAQLELCRNAFCREEKRIANAGTQTSARLRNLHLWRFHQRSELHP